MAEFSRNKSRDKYIWDNKRFDNSIPYRNANMLKQSVIEVRKVYSNMSDREFVNWYSRKYRVEANFVRSVLEKYKKV